MRHEAGVDMSTDEFYLEGIRIMAEEAKIRTMQKATAVEEEEQLQASRDVGLLEGKLKREKLKKNLFAHLNN
jgi:hypothetical protein